MAEPFRYHGFMASSHRWGGFEMRDDDIIISTPSKSGTTWMQTLVALLVFDGVPPRPVNELSPWLDMNVRPVEEVRAFLGAQTHRRFIKTHTPLDGLPWDERVTYLTVGRDPRDAYVSMRHHMANINRDIALETRMAAVGGEDLATLPVRWPDADDVRAHVAAFLDLHRGTDSGDASLAHLLHHLRLAWEARSLPNVHLFHYADLLADLPGELRRVAGAIGIPITGERANELATHATFTAMRGRANETAPEAELGMWQDTAGFFRGGRHGDGEALMTAPEQERYRVRVAELASDPALVTWLHDGWQR